MKPPESEVMFVEIMGLIRSWIERGFHPASGVFIFAVAGRAGVITAPRRWRFLCLKALVRGLIFGL
ncbi:MAG: hypothetical protein LN413_05745 [Candidatus Thermoplasmatota archaeon]|nr:hypothetical protein [Candidatus Thermoplasmatota archaeon]